MKKLLLLSAMLLSCGIICLAQSLSGSWNGKLTLGPQSLTIVLNIASDGSCTLDSPDQSAKGIPCATQHLSTDSIRIDIPAIGGSYSARLTGGKLSLTTSLSYIRQLNGNKQQQFMNVPLSLTFTQPLFGVNTLKWQRRIAPVRYREARASFLSATEEVTGKTITYFFQLLLAREQLAIARQNLENSEKLYKIAEAKRRIGQISENDRLQLRLSMLNARAALTDSETELRSKQFQLCSFLGLEGGGDIEPVLPERVPDVTIGYDDALQKALENNWPILNWKRG